MERAIIHYQKQQIDMLNKILHQLKDISSKLEPTVISTEKNIDEPEKQSSNTTSLYNLFYEELEKGSK